jgi:hypothetical protein
MTQAVPNEWAKDELLLAGIIRATDFVGLIETYHNVISSQVSPDTPALMLLEEQPRRIIAQGDRQNLLRFEFFDPHFDFTLYTSGRIFHELGELRWERLPAGIQIVYTGHTAYKPTLQDAQEIALDSHKYKDRAYLLFGERLDQQELDRIGAAARPGDFAEVRIPRLLRYPQVSTLNDAKRVQLIAREYPDAATAVNVAYRFKNLAPFSEQAETLE